MIDQSELDMAKLEALPWPNSSLHLRGSPRPFGGDESDGAFRFLTSSLPLRSGKSFGENDLPPQTRSDLDVLMFPGCSLKSHSNQ